jgi:PAS domain S-box-containing protein
MARSDSELDRALTGGHAQTVGRFRFFIDDQRWEWSDEVQQIHGYAPGELPEPTTAQVLAHKHPDDVEHVLGALEDTRRSRAAFSTRHRMIDKQGREHRVAVVGDLMRDDQGNVIGTEGFYIDVTSAQDAYEDRISEGLGDIVDQRAAIEQAKGMLGVIYGLDDDAAFQLLKWLSQRSNQKLRTLAERLVVRFRAMSGPILPERGAYDDTLMALGSCDRGVTGTT